jgi:hypothetical protein
VAAELEARWDGALNAVEEAQRRLDTEIQSLSSITDEQRERMLDLGRDLQTVWESVDAPFQLKKRILRTVLNEVVADVDHKANHVVLHLHWAGGVHTKLEIRKNKVGRMAMPARLKNPLLTPFCSAHQLPTHKSL